MYLLIVATVLHLLPDEALTILGLMSDVVSDMSPTILRPIEHIVFTILLN